MSPDDERKLRRAGTRVIEATALRNELVRQAHARGDGLREIARAVGLSHQGVKKIVERA